ncbi:MAG: hypothetical protein WA354_13440 [Terracidiphilus sp.]
MHHGTLKHQLKHFFYASGWKKFEPLWDMLIRARQLTRVTPLLEAVLSRVTGKMPQPHADEAPSPFPIISPDIQTVAGSNRVQQQRPGAYAPSLYLRPPPGG